MSQSQSQSQSQTTLVGSVGRWHGSMVNSNAKTLRWEIEQERRAIHRAQAEIAESRKLLAIHRAQLRNLERRLTTRLRSEQA